MKNNNKGAVYITVIVITTVVLILLGFLLGAASGNARAGKTYADGVRAYYIAQSGVDKAMAYALAHREESYDSGAAESSFLTPQYTDPYSVSWKISYDDTNDVYTISSKGTYKGKFTRNLEVLITIGSNDKITILQWKLV